MSRVFELQATQLNTVANHCRVIALLAGLIGITPQVRLVRCDFVVSDDASGGQTRGYKYTYFVPEGAIDFLPGANIWEYRKPLDPRFSVKRGFWDLSGNQKTQDSQWGVFNLSGEQLSVTLAY